MSEDRFFRYRLTIEYDGTPFVGWQRQENGLSVQQAISDALEKFCQSRIAVHGAGRTDAGVHARGQCAHIDLPRHYPPDTVANAVNQHLKPLPVAILRAEEASADFHARFSARMRHYAYRIINRRAPLCLERERAWLVHAPLDAEAMAQAARLLEGRHDFTTYRSVHCQAKSPVKTLERLEVARFGEEIAIEASARSFMHNQVRSLVGSLKMVGEGKWRPDQVKKALEARDRAACGPVAPACGLCLMAVDY
jgi:tRNA pseudouridine38-40 synthase